MNEVQCEAPCICEERAAMYSAASFMMEKLGPLYDELGGPEQMLVKLCECLLVILPGPPEGAERRPKLALVPRGHGPEVPA